MATPKKKLPAWLTVEEAAAYVGSTPAELMFSRFKGMSPGKDGVKKDGVLRWRRADLVPASAPPPVDE